IASLGHSSGEDILAADIDALASGTAELLIELSRIALRKLLHRANAKKLKIAEHGWSHGN
ncbi:MAG TPA: hypothetical protein VIJ01_00470, partial [Candidatus Angelobacter sp.]